MRWSLAIKAVAHDLDGAEERLLTEASRDRSDRGQRSVIRAQASRPSVSAKHEAWERINGRGYGSDYLTRSAIAGFQWRHQRFGREQVILAPAIGPAAPVEKQHHRVIGGLYRRVDVQPLA